MPDGDVSNDPSDNEPVLLPRDDETIRDLLDVERLRIERDNRRTSRDEKAFELVDAQNKREFEYASATRDANLRLRSEQLTFLRRVVWAGVAFIAFLTLGLLAFALFGNDEQRDLVAKIAVPGLIGLAGYGVVTTLTRVVRAFTKDA